MLVSCVLSAPVLYWCSLDIGSLHKASIGEVVFADTFESGIQSIGMDRHTSIWFLTGETYFHYGPAMKWDNLSPIFAAAIGYLCTSCAIILVKISVGRCLRNADLVT